MSDGPQLIVGISDIKIGKNPARILTNLGSCVGVCLYSSYAKAGGMLHCMFPIAGDNRDHLNFCEAKYADSGVHELVAELKRAYGIEPHTLTAKIFGGANMLKTLSMNIGQQNEQSIRAVLKELHIPILSFKTGGEKGYQIDFNMEDGSVLCRVFGEEPQEF